MTGREPGRAHEPEHEPGQEHGQQHPPEPDHDPRPDPQPEPDPEPRARPPDARVGPRRGARVERAAAACFTVAMLAAVALAVVYWEGGQAQAEGVLLAVITGGIGVGIVLWAKHFLPGVEISEEREELPSSEAEVGAFRRDYVAGARAIGLQEAAEGGRPATTAGSRRLLLASALGALAAFGAALLFPVRSLGPRPGAGLKRTAYAGGGRRVVRRDGTPLRPRDLPTDGVLTVWPEGHAGAADAPTLLIRLRREHDFRPRAGREGWTVDRVVAYSKLCTHVGCPVGLYQAASGLLLCPCHQSTFDVLDGARPLFGPAARSLPQLPLDVDGDGFLVARGDFSDPVGPGFWDRGR